MKVPVDAVASDLSFEVLRLRAQRRELGTQTLDSTNQQLYALPSQAVCFDAFLADASVSRDTFQPLRVQP